MGRRTILIIVFAVALIAVIIVGLIFIAQSDSPQPTPVVDDGTPGYPGPGDGTPGAPPPGPGDGPTGTVPPLVEVVVSLQTVPRGHQITAAELVKELRVRENIDPNVIFNFEDAIGKYARMDIFQGETLTTDALVDDPTLVGVLEYSPSSLVPFGFLAQAIPIDRLSSVAYSLDEGDYIDILISFTLSKLDPEFQTLLENGAIFRVVMENEEGGSESLEIIDQFGRVEELANGDLALISPSEEQRLIPVAMVIQNAKVIQVGEYSPPEPVAIDTPTPEPVGEGTMTPTPAPAAANPTPIPPPDVIVVALLPQQQLLLRYALETDTDIDLALRGINDGQLYDVVNVDTHYLLERFNIEIPPDFNYVAGPTPTPSDAQDGGSNGDAEQPTATPPPANDGSNQ